MGGARDLVAITAGAEMADQKAIFGDVVFGVSRLNMIAV